MQGSHQKLQQQVEGQVEWWRGQVDELKVQLRGEATRVLDLQKKAYNARMAQEAATQVIHTSAIFLACTFTVAVTVAVTVALTAAVTVIVAFTGAVTLAVTVAFLVALTTTVSVAVTIAFLVASRLLLQFLLLLL